MHTLRVCVQSTSHIDASASITEMESETDSRLRLTLDLDSDKFQCFNHREELDSAVQLPNFRSLVAWHAACMMLHIAQG